MAGKTKTPQAQYAFVALFVALLACVSTGLLGAVKGVLALEMFTLDETTVGTINLILQISIALVLIGLGAYVFMSPDETRRFLTGRQARYGSNSLIMSVAFLGIVFGVNYLAYQNPDFLGAPWDLTEDKASLLAPETLQTLATLPENVKATAFYSSLDRTSAEELLTKFKTNSGGKFDYEFVDPNLDPLTAREAGITGDGKILLQMGTTKEVASFASEDELTKTLIRLISPEPRAVYFLQGHGEAALGVSSGEQYGMSVAKETLESKNYTVQELNLLTAKEIPEDAKVIVIAGPRKPLTSDEVARLKTYVSAGGALLVMQDPTLMTEFGNSPDPLNDYLTSDWGITLNDDVVIDYVNTQNPLQAVSWDTGAHPITQNLTEDYIVILPQARSLTITGEVEGVMQTPLLLTTEQSWGETELTSGQNPTFEAEKDFPGPLNLAVAGENTTQGGRVVVFGNSLFATDDGFNAYGNGNIFINSVDWAAEEEDLINLTVRDRQTRVFTPPDNLQFIIIIIVSVFVLPGMVVFAGISSWLARRRRG